MNQQTILNMKIESLPHQAALKLDSISLKLNELQTKVEALTTQNKLLQDSVTNISKTALENTLQTSWYETHLATYTAIFGILLALIFTVATIINWLGLIKPFQKKLEVKIHDVDSKFINFKKDHIDGILDNLLSVSGDTYRSIAFNHKDTTPSVSFLFAIRFLMLFINGKFKMEVFEQWLDFAIDYLNRSEFTFDDISEINDEIFSSINDLLKSIEKPELQEKIKLINNNFSTIYNNLKEQKNSQTTLNLSTPESNSEPAN